MPGLARAALSAAKPSGSSTSVAMTIPTTGFGTSSLATPISSVSVSDFARPTMATSAANSRPALTVAVLLDGGGACASSLSSFTARK
jgi:hypothetical protein